MSSQINQKRKMEQALAGTVLPIRIHELKVCSLFANVSGSAFLDSEHLTHLSERLFTQGERLRTLVTSFRLSPCLKLDKENHE